MCEVFIIIIIIITIILLIAFLCTYLHMRFHIFNCLLFSLSFYDMNIF